MTRNKKELIPNAHYWLKTPRAEWIIGQYVTKYECSALQPDISGFMIIGSTVVVATDWFIEIVGPISKEK